MPQESLPTGLWLTPLLHALLPLAGIVSAAVLIRRCVGASVCVMVGLGMMLAAVGLHLWGNIMLWQWVGDDPAPVRRTAGAMHTAGQVLSTLSIVPMVIAALGWRSLRVPSAVASAGAPGAQALEAGTLHSGRLPAISKAASMVGIFVPAGLGLVLSAIAWAILLTEGNPLVSLAFSVPGMLAVVPSVVVFMMLLARLWHTLQAHSDRYPQGAGLAGVARTTPGAAVGRLFIPFYNFYWVFVAWRGLAQDANATLDHFGVRHVRVPVGVATAAGVIATLSVIPYLGVVISLANMVLLPIFLSTSIDACNAIRAVSASAGSVKPDQQAALAGARSVEHGAWFAGLMWLAGTVAGMLLTLAVVGVLSAMDALDDDHLAMCAGLVFAAQYGFMAIARRHRPWLLLGLIVVPVAVYLAEQIPRSPDTRVAATAAFAVVVSTGWAIGMSRSIAQAVAWVLGGALAIMGGMMLSNVVADMAGDLVRNAGGRRSAARSVQVIAGFSTIILVISVPTALLAWWSSAQRSMSPRA